MYGMTRIKCWPPIHWPPTTGVHNLLIFYLSLQSRCILQCDQFVCLRSICLMFKVTESLGETKSDSKGEPLGRAFKDRKNACSTGYFFLNSDNCPRIYYFKIVSTCLSIVVCRNNLGTRNCLANLQWGSNQQRKATVSITIPWSKGLQCWRRAVSWL